MTIGWPAAVARSVPIRKPSSIASTASSRVRPLLGAQLGGHPDLGVHDAVGGEVLGAFGRDPGDRVGPLHDPEGVGEGLEVELEALAVGAAPEPGAQVVDVGRRQAGVAVLGGEVDDRRRAQAAVEVVVEQRLGRPLTMVARSGIDRWYSAPRRPRRARAAASAAATRVGAVPPMTSHDASAPSSEAAARSVSPMPGSSARRGRGRVAAGAEREADHRVGDLVEADARAFRLGHERADDVVGGTERDAAPDQRVGDGGRGRVALGRRRAHPLPGRR